jgi:hypothetical protein
MLGSGGGRGNRAGTVQIRLGTAVSVTEDGLWLVRFDGAEEASGKGYPVLRNADIGEGDRVVCLRTGGSYIVLGAYGGMS